MPSARLTPPTPSRVSTPSSSSHPLSNSTHHPQPDMQGIDHADPLQRHHPHHAHPPRHPHRTPPQPPGRATNTHTRQRQVRATPPTTTGPEDMRHTHPTTRSHRSPPDSPTAHTQASTHTHGRQAISGPHTRAQPHRRDHHHQPSRPPAATTTTTTVTTARDDMSTNRSSTNHAQRSDQHKHQKSRLRNNHAQKNKPQQPQGITPHPTSADRYACYVRGS